MYAYVYFSGKRADLYTHTHTHARTHSYTATDKKKTQQQKPIGPKNNSARNAQRTRAHRLDVWSCIIVDQVSRTVCSTASHFPCALLESLSVIGHSWLLHCYFDHGRHTRQVHRRRVHQGPRHAGSRSLQLPAGFCMCRYNMRL
jgi:hypothetical protein